MKNLSEATRPIMWNIDNQVIFGLKAEYVMYLLFFIAFGVCVYGVYSRIKVWKSYKPDQERLSDWGKRFWLLVKELIFQRRVMNTRFPGIFHSLIFYSFIVLVITTTVIAVEFDFLKPVLGVEVFRGWLYVILTVGSEIAGLLIMIGIAMALWRRHVSKPKELPQVLLDTWALVLLGLLVVTGFVVEGIRLATLPDPWEMLSFVGYVFSLPFRGIATETGQLLHRWTWWIHTVIAMYWIATIPYTKFVHLLFLPTNIFFSKLQPRATLKRQNIEQMMESEDFNEDEFSLGVHKVKDLTWKQAMDLDACIKCGRCEMMCPSTQAGEPFGPRQFLAHCLDLSEKLRKEPPVTKPEEAEEAEEKAAIVGNAFDEHFLWYCRTCGACMEICPAAIDHVDDMIEVKRNEILMQGRAPSEAQRVLKSMESIGNPFSDSYERTKWMEDVLKVRVVEAGDEVDVLYFVGCITAFDTQKQKIARDLCELLKRCGVDFGVMGSGEICCGDPARLLGQEMQFQSAAAAQVEELNSRKFRILLTACPHCYTVLKNEYPQFGGNYTVMHHSAFLAQLMAEGKLKPTEAMANRVVFHDPCYLGRYHNEFDAPRQILNSMPQLQLGEMKDHHSKSFCCGGGGGHFWMDLKGGTDRVNNMRVAQAQAAKAEVIATGCGFCMGMLDDAVKVMNLEESVKVKDIASLLLESLPKEAESEE